MDLPPLEPVGQLTLRQGEVFIAVGGFEERALEFPRVLRVAHGTGANAILLEYLPHDDKNKFAVARSLLCNAGCQVAPMAYNRYAPGEFDKELRDRLMHLQARAVCLDISGMSRLAIMIVAGVVRERNMPLRVVYAEAIDYGPSQEEFELAKSQTLQHLPTSFIHTGVYDVLRVPALSSIRMQNHATVLIAFDSFNEALCQALVNVINPSRFILINGRPPREELKWREKATEYVHHRLREEWSIEDDNDPVKVTSTLHYEETYNVLTDIYWRFSDSYRIIIAPTGSKMQTIGCHLLRAVHSDVHVEYPTVQGFFADKYSTGVRERWQLDFGEMSEFVTKLRQRELGEHLGLPEEPVNTEVE